MVGTQATGQDLRSYLAQVGDHLVHVRKPVDPLTEMGGLCQRIEQPLIFEEVKGHPGWRVVDRLLSTRQYVALAAGTTPTRLMADLAARWLGPPRWPAVLVDRAPVKARVLTGTNVDLEALPVAVSSPEDSGRFISGGHLVSKNPETGDHNAAFCRVELKGRDVVSISIFRPDTLRNIALYRERGRTTMPIAVCIGHHPAFDMSAAASIHHPGYSEHEMTANLLGGPVELTSGVMTDLHVPARMEIVIEAELDITRHVPNGPFGEYTLHYGYDPNGYGATVRAVLMREDAIYRHLNSTRFTDHQVLTGTAHSVQIYMDLVRKGHVVHDIACPPYGGRQLLVIKTTPRYDGEVRDMFLTACARNAVNVFFVFVDDDVDLDDPRDVLHVIATNTDPIYGVVQFDGLPSNRLTPRARNRDNPYRCVSGKVMIDATRGSTMGQPELRKQLTRIGYWPGIDPKDFV